MRNLYFTNIVSKDFLIFAGIVLLTTGILATVGVTVTTNYTNDTPILLDGGWRVYQGQRPHVDFYSPLGPVMYLLVAFGMWLGGLSASALVYMNVVVFLAMSLWAWMLAQKRMPPLFVLFFAIYTGFIIIGTNVHGHPFNYLGYAALYNRYGMAFLALVLVESFVRYKYVFKTEFWWGVSTGVLVALLFFLKINFFLVALGGIILGWWVVGRPRLNWIGLFTGAGFILLAMLIYLRFDLAAVFRDLYMGIAARSGKAFTLQKMLRAIIDFYTLLPLVFFVVIFVSWQQLPDFKKGQ